MATTNVRDAESNGKPTTPPFADKPEATNRLDQRAANPFDPASLRLSQDFASTVGVKKALVTIPVKKPPKEWYVRVHPGEEYRLTTATIELKEDREVYLVAPALWSELSTEATFSPRALFLGQSRQNVLFFWPIRLPAADGRVDDWSKSAVEAATMAQQRWVRVTSNMSLGAYEIFFATGDLPEPKWPEQPLGELLKIAFRDRFIDSMDHPVLKRLRGEI